MYIELVMLLNFFVDFFLLVAVNRLSGYPPGYGRTAAAAALGGIYGGLALVPELRFLSAGVWQGVFLVLMAVVAFGWRRSALHRGIMFVLLSMALCGVAVGMGQRGTGGLVASTAFVGILALLSFRSGSRGQKFVPVQLRHEGKCVKLVALRDTGNSLRDPLTGQPVLVVGAQTAQTLTGLTAQQLRAPLDAVEKLPGSRLIPYRTVGRSGGMLLAIRIRDVRIGHWKGSSLVAFSPEGLEEEEYQALTGGVA